MRYDNDVNAQRRGIRGQVINFVRAHLSNPRRVATYGLVAAVGSGALMLTSTQHDATAAPTTAPAAIVTHALSDSAESAAASAIKATKPAKDVKAIKTAKTAKPAPAAKKAAKSTRSSRAVEAEKLNAMIKTKPVAGLDKVQMKNAALIIKAGQDLGISERGQIVAVSTAMQESNLYNRASNVVPESLKYEHQGMGSDYDSVGLFQQRYTTGWGTVKTIMNPSSSAKSFYKALKQVDGWQKMPITVAAQTVQGSAFPDAYAKHQGNATAVVKAVNKSVAQH